MRATRMLRTERLKTLDRRADRQLGPVLANVLTNTGAAGGEFHDTSGFHERDTEYRPTIGFTYDPWLDRS